MNKEQINTVGQERPYGDPVERVARALCWHDQRNPDLMINSGLKEFVIGGDGIATLKSSIIPAWTQYCEEATRIVLVMQALGEE